MSPESTSSISRDETLEIHSEDELATALAEATRTRRNVIAIGRDSRAGFGVPIPSPIQRLKMSSWTGVTRFARDDLTCGVRAGTTWRELLDVVEAEGLTVEAGPFVAPATRTVGGIFGEAPPSSRGHDRASLRSQVIGLRAIDGTGRAFEAGGQVVKNVAGYDLCKLFVGSGGAWFVATEVQLRLVSIPHAATVCASESMSRSDAAALWLSTRRECSELRACDLILETSGAARVEFLAAGAKELVASLTKRDRFRVVREDRAAWNDCSSDVSSQRIVCRGRVLASDIRDGWCEKLPTDCVGRIGLQGAFEIGAENGLASRDDGRSFVRATRGTAVAQSAHPDIDQRLANVFGVSIAPTRSSFDTARTN